MADRGGRRVDVRVPRQGVGAVVLPGMDLRARSRRARYLVARRRTCVRAGDRHRHRTRRCVPRVLRMVVGRPTRALQRHPRCGRIRARRRELWSRVVDLGGAHDMASPLHVVRDGPGAARSGRARTVARVRARSDLVGGRRDDDPALLVRIEYHRDLHAAPDLAAVDRAGAAVSRRDGGSRDRRRARPPRGCGDGARQSRPCSLSR
ncbi:hypothetical protein BH11MYX1_BH11MYX1_21720 [soil metagenome]